MKVFYSKKEVRYLDSFNDYDVEIRYVFGKVLIIRCDGDEYVFGVGDDDELGRKLNLSREDFVYEKLLNYGALGLERYLNYEKWDAIWHVLCFFISVFELKHVL